MGLLSMLAMLGALFFVLGFGAVSYGVGLASFRAVSPGVGGPLQVHVERLGTGDGRGLEILGVCQHLCRYRRFAGSSAVARHFMLPWDDPLWSPGQGSCSPITNASTLSLPAGVGLLEFSIAHSDTLLPLPPPLGSTAGGTS